MFLRIDVYPGGLQSGAAVSKQDPTQSPQPGETLFAYPALVKDDKTTLLAVGRKDPNDIILSQDKSVSRMHCKFSLSRSDTPGSSYSLTLENLSKTGCFVVAPRPRATGKEDQAQHDDGGNDSDATDDGPGHGASTQAVGASQTQRPGGDLAGAIVPPLSGAAEAALRGRGLDPETYHLEPVGTDQSRKMSDLEQNNSFVIVQCGKLESTLVLSRNDMVVPSKAQSLVDAELCESVGARFEPNRFGPFTHFVAKKYSATTSMLTAWCRGVEFVTPDYLHTLAERVSPNDAMPVLDDYRPAPSSSSAKDGFWFKAPPSWRGWTFVTPSKASAEENVEWMRSTQAEILVADKAADLEEISTRAASSDPPALRYFALKQSQWISKAQLEKADVVVCDSVKTLASRLVEYHAPDGKVLEVVEVPRPPVPSTGGKEPPMPSTGGTETTVAGVYEPMEPERPPQPEPDVEMELTEPGASGAGGEGHRDPTRDEGIANDKGGTGETRIKSSRASKREVQSLTPPVEPKRRKRAAASTTEEIDADAFERVEDRDSNEPNDSPAIDPNEEEKYLELLSRPRKLAKPSADGWLASIDARRRGAEEGSDYMRIKSTAVTAVVKGFVLQEPLGQNRSNESSASRSRREGGGVDFRGFRKNHVVKATIPAPISLISVQPKETQVAVQMEEQRQQLEERQRMADELFRDPEFPGGRAKLRR
jgi:FHA domain